MDLANPYVAKLKNVIKLNKKTENLENIQSKIASLSRVINSIALQNSFQRESLTTKNVMAAALDVHDPYILHAIEKTDVQNVTNTIKTLDLLANQSMDTITEITLALNKLALGHDTTSSDIPNSPALFNVSRFSFSEAIIRNIYDLHKIIISLIDELKLASPQEKKIVTWYRRIKFLTNQYSVQLKLSFPQLQPLFDSFENARSFIVDIEQYQLLTNDTYSTLLIKSLDNLQPYTTTIETLSNSERIQYITEQFDEMNKLINKTVNISDKYTLLGLPRGSEYLEIFLEDFDDKQPFLLVFITFAVALVCALVVLYLWIRTSKDVQKVNQCKEETVELGKKQEANSC
uniref:WSN domain-containing protein n=1 Tax=Caenorhabditis japonica TaxID=281687 RepID=A0A8R1E9T8_CAEJA